MTTEEVKLKQAQEPWGKLLIEMGWSPYDTESSARAVAAHAAKKLEEKDAEIARLQEACALRDCGVSGNVSDRLTLFLVSCDGNPRSAYPRHVQAKVYASGFSKPVKIIEGVFIENTCNSIRE